MDPRLKFEVFDEWLKVVYFGDERKIEEIKNEVISLLHNLYNNYKEKYGNDISSITSNSTSSSHLYKFVLEMFKNRKKTTISSPNNVTCIDRYISVDTIPFEENENFDILLF